MATTNAFCLASPPLARICLHGDLQRFGRRLSLYVNVGSGHPGAVVTGAGIPPSDGEGWYQIRIRERYFNVRGGVAHLHEPLGEGAVIHIMPRLAGAGKGRTADCARGGSHQGSSSLRWQHGCWRFSPGSRWFFCHRCCFH
ncbi:tail assembly protein [Escherichia coli]|nr:tail assembly protein [Escherichia coli]